MEATDPTAKTNGSLRGQWENCRIKGSGFARRCQHGRLCFGFGTIFGVISTTTSKLGRNTSSKAFFYRKRIANGDKSAQEKERRRHLLIQC